MHQERTADTRRDKHKSYTLIPENMYISSFEMTTDDEQRCEFGYHITFSSTSFLLQRKWDCTSNFTPQQKEPDLAVIVSH